jgi:GH24 family phage-related lysozyme (muramidase)
MQVLCLAVLMAASLLASPCAAQYHPKAATPCPHKDMVVVGSASVDNTGETFIKAYATLSPTFELNAAQQGVIGYGHNCVTQGSCDDYSAGYITLTDAETLFDSDLQTAVNTAAAAFPSAYLSQNQFDVLIDLVYATGSVPSSVATVLSSAGTEPVAKTDFEDAVRSACEATDSGISAKRCAAEVKLAGECHAHHFHYEQTGGEFCSGTNKVGLCLNKAVYECPGGKFINKNGQCGGATASCCLVPVSKASSAAATSLTLEGGGADGIPTFAGPETTVYPRTFCDTTTPSC